jgi:polyferredoxin
LGGLVFVGFLFNAPFVLAQINMVLIGYWPEWQTNLYWYLLILGLLLFKATEEWNVYCYDFCPFGALQEIAAKIGGAKPQKLRWSSFLLWAQRLLTLTAISLALIYRNPGLSSYEVFGTAFALEGSNFQFALLAIILLSSLFLYRPWCRHLCPLHKNATEGLFDNTRRIVRTAWQKLTKRPNPA